MLRLRDRSTLSSPLFSPPGGIELSPLHEPESLDTITSNGWAGGLMLVTSDEEVAAGSATPPAGAERAG